MINDIIENRIEKIVLKALLVDFPENASFTLSEFVSMKQQHIKSDSILLQGKHTEIKYAFNDLIGKFSAQISKMLSLLFLVKVLKNWESTTTIVYQALLHLAKNSMNSLKKRMGSRSGMFILNSLNSLRPFFHVDVQLMLPCVSLSPSLDNIQECINQSAQAIISCYKTVFDWVNFADAECSNEMKRIFFWAHYQRYRACSSNASPNGLHPRCTEHSSWISRFIY